MTLAVYPQRPVLAAGRQRRIKVCRKPQLVRGRHRPVCADHQTATFHSIPERFANLGSLLIKPTHLNTWNLGFTKDNNHFPCATPQVSLDSPSSTVERPRPLCLLGLGHCLPASDVELVVMGVREIFSGRQDLQAGIHRIGWPNHGGRWGSRRRRKRSGNGTAAVPRATPAGTVAVAWGPRDRHMHMHARRPIPAFPVP